MIHLYFKRCRDSIASSGGYCDYIVTGAVDDFVKIWQIRNDKLELSHKLSGHSLGVVSLDVSSNGQSKYLLFLFQ